MDSMATIVALLIAVIAVAAAAIFYSKSKASEKNIKTLRGDISGQVERQVATAIANTQQRMLELQTECSRLREQVNQVQQEALRASSESQTKLFEKDRELDRAKGELERIKSSVAQEREIAVNRAVAESNRKLVESERKNAELNNDKTKLEKQSQEAKQAYEFQIKEKDKEIERIRNDKAKLSVKMLGESLEQHCEIAFNQVRTYAFPNAKFGKDNDTSQGSKGDYIYRECDSDGVELLSIMFEMKNEAETSVHTKKNSDHFKKLDRDRKNKGCEYAVLVSLLEPENEFYDAGIADVSYEYPKMFVIRPQFFVPFIGLLRNAALSSLKAKQELERMRQEDVNLTKFEDKLKDLKGTATGFYDNTHTKCESAKKSIGQAITKMESIQRDIEKIDASSSKAKDKVDDLTIRKLTWGNPVMKSAFEAVRQKLGTSDLD